MERYEQIKQRAFMLCDKGDILGGARELERLVAIAREMDEPRCLIEALTEFGGLIKYLDRFSEAEAAFQEARRLLETHFPGHGGQYANCLTNLGNLYRLMGDADRAEEHFVDAMERLRALGRTETEDYAGLRNNLALLYQQTGRYGEAAELHGRNLDWLERTGGPNYQKGTSLGNLAAAWLELGEFEQAERAVRQCMACYEDEVSRESALYLSALNTLAAIWCRSGRIEEGYRLLSEQVEPLCAAVYGKESRAYQGVLRGMELTEQKLREVAE